MYKIVTKNRELRLKSAATPLIIVQTISIMARDFYRFIKDEHNLQKPSSFTKPQNTVKSKIQEVSHRCTASLCVCAK